MKLLILFLFVVTPNLVFSQGTSFLASRLLGFSPVGFRLVFSKSAPSNNCHEMIVRRLILTFYFYTSYLWKQTIYISAKLFAVLVAALSSRLSLL